VPLSQLRRAFREDNLERWPHGGFEQVAGKCGAVATTQDAVDMQRRLAVRT
jgi:hypothetical protein